VFQWRLDVVPQFARLQQAQAQLDEVQAMSIKARTGVAAEVEEAYADVVDWQKRLDAYRQAVKYAKTWLSTVQQAIDIGRWMTRSWSIRQDLRGATLQRAARHDGAQPRNVQACEGDGLGRNCSEAP